MDYTITANGQLFTGEAKPDLPLVWVLRDNLGRNAVMIGCGRGNCGACTVRMNGEIVHSCQIPISQALGAVITTPGYKPPAAPSAEAGEQLGGEGGQGVVAGAHDDDTVPSPDEL